MAERRRGAGGLRGLDAVPPSAPTNTNTPGPPPIPSLPEPPQPEQQPASVVERRQTPAPARMQAPQVEIPQHQRSNRTAQLNFRVTEQTRDYVQRQLKLVAGESGLRDNQVSALAVQVLVDAIPEIRYRALVQAGVIEADHEER